MKNIPVRQIAPEKTLQSSAGRFSVRDLQQVLNGKDLVHDLHRHDFYFVLAVQRGSGMHEIQLFDGGNEDWGYYGYGFRIQPYQRSSGHMNAGTLIRHGGTMNGYISNYHYYKEDDLTVILLCNNRDIPIRRITYNLKEIAIGEQKASRINKYKE